MAIYSDFTDSRYLKNNKIRVILDENHLNASQFADAIKVQRSTISHILAYRNRPSQDILEKIVAWNDKYSFDWFRTQTPEEAKIIAQLIESQGYGGAKMQNPTAQESREKPVVTKSSPTIESRTPAMKQETSSVNTTIDSMKPRRAVLITIVYDDGSSQVIPVDPNSKINQLLGQ
ncbi:MAG: helix-turn-helix transcriptional regulator [Spirosomataceae bacterium]